MTEERSCKTCGLFDKCPGCSGTLPNWQPIAQEKKTMENKVIFESEEECAEFLCNVYNHNKEYCLRSLVPMAKQAGYIRKSAVEETEEMYNEFFNYTYRRGAYHRDNDQWQQHANKLTAKQHEAIQELKSEIARLKK